MWNFMTCEGVQFVVGCDSAADRRNKAKAMVDRNYSNKDYTTHGDFCELMARDDIDADKMILRAMRRPW